MIVTSYGFPNLTDEFQVWVKQQDLPYYIVDQVLLECDIRAETGVPEWRLHEYVEFQVREWK